MYVCAYMYIHTHRYSSNKVKFDSPKPWSSQRAADRILDPMSSLCAYTFI